MNYFISKTVLVCLLFVIASSAGCSVYQKRFFNTPLHHSGKIQSDAALNERKINPRLESFEKLQLPSAFVDTISKTVIMVRLKNEYQVNVIGPVFLPLVSFKSGYGYPQSKTRVFEDEDDRQLIVELMIKKGEGDQVSFIPSQFEIKRQKDKNFISRVAFIDGIEKLTATIECIEPKTIQLVFKPGVHVEDLPIIFLHTLKINGQSFHPEGLPFKIGVKSFYSPIVAVNG